ncbi:MAG TPA: twin-arginine translocase subunit TatC [Opitutus sp.]|nr:twin-arginine translocase subunit TatC [Opitutus sp.]
MTDVEHVPEDEDLGEKKSFWDHLRDLRSALLRSAVAVGIALIVCLLIADKLVTVLEYPLKRIDIFQKPQPTVSFKIGKSQIGPYQVDREQFAGFNENKESVHLLYEIGVTEVGGQQVATLKTLPTPADATSLKVRLLNLSPAEAFFVAFRVALYGALIVAAPFWVYFMGQFFLPALNVRERSVLFQWFGWGVFLFFTGVLLTYFLLLPIALRASVEYSHLMGFEAYDWRAESYIGFVTRFLLGMGIGFQFPIVVLLLVKLGFLTTEQLAHYRRHVVVLSLIIGAVLTTPEVFTQIAMAVPLYLLYEVSIAISRYWDWKRRRAEAAAARR